jgi:predicted RNA-binding protein with PUA-like domain
MNYWLMKSEPEECSVDDVLAMPNATVPWFGVRNYLARNFMRDHMRLRDGVLFYHSSCAQPGVVGLAEVASTPYPDATQFDSGSKYFDPKASPETPRWQLVDVRVTRKTRTLGLAELRAHSDLTEMVLLRRGNRLSITPITPTEWNTILGLLAKSSD